jgi:hypothetical protein
MSSLERNWPRLESCDPEANTECGVPTLVSYVSQFTTLMPGDVISTGTLAGVGLGMSPPQYLKAGDVVELGIEDLGEARQRVFACGLRVPTRLPPVRRDEAVEKG